jgi:hypothetical protein
VDSWLRSLANLVPAPLRNFATGLIARISSVWTVITGFLATVRTQWQNLRRRVGDWVDAQLRHALAVATTLKWIVLTYIPRQLGDLARSVRTWTADLISKLESKAVSLFNTAVQWASTHIQGVLNSLSVLRNWAIGQVNAILDPLGRIAKMVFGVLSTPERLADWIVGAMAGRLMDYAKANAHRVESFVVSQRAVIWRIVISVIEDVFTELL